MEEQGKLFEKTKEEKIVELYSNLQMYSKIITHFGNPESKIMFLGEAPVQSHVDSDSSSCFKFDTDLQQKTKSGSVIIKVFEKLNLKIPDFYWDNLYKIPIEKINDSNRQLFHEIMEREIDIVDPDVIICMKANVFEIVKTLGIGVNIDIKRIYHPSYVNRGGISFDNYLIKFKKILENGN